MKRFKIFNLQLQSLQEFEKKNVNQVPMIIRRETKERSEEMTVGEGTEDRKREREQLSGERLTELHAAAGLKP